MRPERLEKFARLLATFCQRAEAGDRVLVERSGAAADVGTAVATALVACGAEVEVAGLGEAWSDVDRLERVTGYVTLRTTGEAEAMPAAAIPEAAQRLKMTLRKTTTVLPDETLAIRAGLRLTELEDYYATLLFLDDDDPVPGLEELREAQEALLVRLRAAGTVRIESPDTDLTLVTGGRGWVNSYGRRNVPSGEMYTSPVEASAEGEIRFGVPNFKFGEPVRGVTLEFRQGELVRAEAEEGNDLLRAAIATDAGARRVGELGIGGNRRMDRFLGSTLFDEKVAGTVHLALGRSYPQTGGTNLSALHWDLVKDLRHCGRLSLDGVPFLEGGRFVGV